MSRSPRIPQAELTGLYGSIVKRMSRKMFGEVPEPVAVAWHNRKVLNSTFSIEPLLTSPDAAEDAELAVNVSIAMLTVLETLGPVQRAVFVLHEVFETIRTTRSRRS
jgi:hypothetical protein